MKILDQETINDYIETMQIIVQKSEEPHFDQEMAHIHADNCLCDILEEMGLNELVNLFNELPKWYA